jgi:hypothetical protein
MAVLHAIRILAFIFALVWPDFDTLTMLQVVLPKASVFAAIHVVVCAKPICFVALPLA